MFVHFGHRGISSPQIPKREVSQCDMQSLLRWVCRLLIRFYVRAT
jgi:hypothetical protein